MVLDLWKQLQLFAEEETQGTPEQQETLPEETPEQAALPEQENKNDEKLLQHFRSLQMQSEALKKIFPSFDFIQEMQNPAFVRLTAPDTGIGVEDAYYALHRKEIQAAAMQVTAQMTAQKISNSIQSGLRRPAENGTSGQGASVTTFDYRGATREQRNALKKRILDEAAQGRKVYP